MQIWNNLPNTTNHFKQDGCSFLCAPSITISAVVTKRANGTTQEKPMGTVNLNPIIAGFLCANCCLLKQTYYCLYIFFIEIIGENASNCLIDNYLFLVSEIKLNDDRNA